MVIDNNNSKINYFIPGLQQEDDRKASAELTQQLDSEFKGVFMRIRNMSNTFSLQTKPDSKPYQFPDACSQHITKNHERKT